MNQSSSQWITDISPTRFELGTFIAVEPLPVLVELDDATPPLDLDHWFAERELDRSFTASEVIRTAKLRPGIWFRPAGDHPGVALVFEAVEFMTSDDLRALIRLLHEMGGDSPVNFLRIHHGLSAAMEPIASLTVAQIVAVNALVYSGTDIKALRQRAEGDVLAHFGSAARRTWAREFPAEELDGLGSILDSPDLLVSDLTLGHAAALHVGLRV